MPYYAQIDDSDVCVGISNLKGSVADPKMIQVQSQDSSILGKKLVNGSWEAVAKTADDHLSDFQSARGSLLAETDYVVNICCELTALNGQVPQKITDLVNYRQELRDMTDQPGFDASAPVWPTKP